MSSTQSFIKSLISEHVCKVGECTYSYYKTYHKTIVIKTMWWYWHRIDIDKWTRTETQETNPYIYGQLAFGRLAKTIQWQKNRLFKHMVPGQLDILMQKDEDGSRT